MKKLISIIKDQKMRFLFALIAATAAGGMFLLFIKGGIQDNALFMVSRGDFLREVSISGRVIATKDVDLGFAENGRVARVYARVGDMVAKGGALAELDNGDLRAGILQKEAALEREEASLALLKEGSRAEELEVARAEIYHGEVALAQARAALAESIQDAFTTSDDAVRNTLDQFIDNPRTNPQIDFIVGDAQLENEIENARSKVENMLTEWRKETEKLAAESKLAIAVSDAQTNLYDVSSLLADANAALNKAVSTGNVTQSTIDGYKTDIAAARSSVNSAISSITSAVTAEKSAISALNTASKNLTLKEAGARASDIAAKEAEIKAAKADLGSARARLGKTIMLAPFSGIVTKVDLKEGSIASANVSGVSMISADTFQIESFVPEVNISLIEAGDHAYVTLDAYGDDVIFAAKVASIDPAETIKDGISTYRAILQFDERDERVKSGMTANARITTDKRGGVISIPRGLVLEHGERKYVRVLVDESIRENEIATGAISSLGNVEVLSGLAEGDVIVISEAQ